MFFWVSILHGFSGCRYSCLNLSTCSFWVAFGVFVSRIFFETACFVAFLLIAHGYCIMHEQLSVNERRSIAGLASLLYLTLTGYKAAVPQFAVIFQALYPFLLMKVIRMGLVIFKSLFGHWEQGSFYSFRKFRSSLESLRMGKHLKAHLVPWIFYYLPALVFFWLVPDWLQQSKGTFRTFMLFLALKILIAFVLPLVGCWYCQFNQEG